MIRQGDTVFIPDYARFDEYTMQVAERRGYFETVGARQAELLMRARHSETKAIIMPHTDERNAERMAARRLVERGLLQPPNAFGNARIGWLYRYNLTERGRTCWLHVRTEKGQ